jgi:hypothetical protein
MKEDFVNKTFFATRVVSRNVITDWVQGVRNVLGLRLKSYENAIETTVLELRNEFLNRPTVWYRIDIEQAAKGAFMISIYGEYK